MVIQGSSSVQFLKIQDKDNFVKKRKKSLKKELFVPNANPDLSRIMHARPIS
jgi:hypothetical protein